MSNVYTAKTSPATVLDDYQKLLDKSQYLKTLDKNKPLIIKLNLSWTRFYPACSTWPWQLEGVIKTLLKSGFKPQNIIPIENKTVVTDVVKGSQNNKWLNVLKKYEVKMHYLTDEPYIEYKPKHKLLIMDKIFPKIILPKIIIGQNILHLPTMKMHVFTTTTGAIKNYFGVLKTTRHFAHRYIHETLVDLLQIQKEIHPNILAVMDGSTVGKGSGPRAMEWEIKNYLLASDDLVALDATAAKMMGFNPEKIDYLRLCHKQGLGISNHQKIKIIGENIDLVNWHYQQKDTLASKGQKLIYHHSPLVLEKLLLQSIIVPWSYAASNFYHDWYWWNFFGRWRVNQFLETDWGKLFRSY